MNLSVSETAGKWFVLPLQHTPWAWGSVACSTRACWPNNVTFMRLGAGSADLCNPQKSPGSINSINTTSYYGIGVRMHAVSLFWTHQSFTTRGHSPYGCKLQHVCVLFKHVLHLSMVSNTLSCHTAAWKQYAVTHSSTCHLRWTFYRNYIELSYATFWILGWWICHGLKCAFHI